MNDSTTTLENLKTIVGQFCRERDWDQFHSAKELAIGAVTESSELLEHFRFQSAEQVEAIMNDAIKRGEVENELADILFFIIRFSEKYGVDLASAFENKMAKNSKRYTVKEFKGQNHKART